MPDMHRLGWNLSSSNSVRLFQLSSTQSTVTMCGTFLPGFLDHFPRSEDISFDELSGSITTWVIEGWLEVLAIFAPANLATLIA